MKSKNPVVTSLTGAFAALVFFSGLMPVYADSPGATPLPDYAQMLQKMAGTDAVSGATENAPVDAVSGATPGGGKELEPNFFGLKVSVKAHRVAGYTSGGLLLAAGLIGGVRFYDLMSRAHKYRDDNEIEEIGPGCSPIITDTWKGNQGLRWTHVGLVATGESLYLFDAVTGMSLIGKAKKTRAGTIHRNAFFVHAGLMTADVILGFLLSNALKNGEHEKVVGYGAAHAGIGIAIPIVIIGSGLVADFLPEKLY